ncbi:MAG: hypothetical protein AB7F65_11700 [Dehalococcoidia bacterium]
MNPDDPFFMTQQRSRQIGRALVVIAAVQVLWFLARGSRRSALLALPLGLATFLVAGVLTWVGVTLAVMDWDHPADYPPADADQ